MIKIKAYSSGFQTMCQGISKTSTDIQVRGKGFGILVNMLEFLA